MTELWYELHMQRTIANTCTNTVELWYLEHLHVYVYIQLEYYGYMYYVKVSWKSQPLFMYFNTNISDLFVTLGIIFSVPPVQANNVWLYIGF